VKNHIGGKRRYSRGFCVGIEEFDVSLAVVFVVVVLKRMETQGRDLVLMSEDRRIATVGFDAALCHDTRSSRIGLDSLSSIIMKLSSLA
jgi:hypothetical protein